MVHVWAHLAAYLDQTMEKRKVEGVTCDYLDRVLASVRQLADLAFAEDLPQGDVTADVMGLQGRFAKAHVITRQPIPMCGSTWHREVVAAFCAFNPAAQIKVTCCAEDGARLEAGSVLFELEGDAASIVGLERTLLNFLGRGIGIAAATAVYVDAVTNDRTRILDTRKTLPGFRYFDKYAVLCGGGDNHRLNLSDQVLIKENHLARFGGVAAAVAHVREHLVRPVEIQIEVASFDQLLEAIEVACPLIMLDNFLPETVKRACELERGSCRLEVSGGITLANMADYLHPLLDRISIGALTHSVKAPDLSLLITED